MRHDRHVSTRARFGATVLLTWITMPITMPALAQGEEGLGGIHWKTAEGPTAEPIVTAPGVVLSVKEDRHVVVQLNQVPTAAEREGMGTAGLTLLRYLGSNAFFARVVGGDGVAAAAQAAGVVSAFEIDTNWKLHPMLARGEFPAYSRSAVPAGALQGVDGAENGGAEVEILALYVLFHPDVDLVTDGAAAIKGHGGTVRSVMRSINGVVVWIPVAELIPLAGEDVVQWIEPPLPPLDTVNNSNRAITQADIVQAPPYGLDGTGITALVYDGGYADASHGDFGGRLTVRDASGLSSHATHVSGTVGGSGAGSGGLYRGMAPNVTIESYGFDYDGTGIFLYTNPGDIEVDYNQAINVYGAEVSNNSIGTNTCANGFPCEITGDYGATAMLIDAIVGGSLGAPMRIVWANGNERGCSRCSAVSPGGYHSTAPPACAKNHITVGALNSNDDSMTSFSSWGPTDDGRIKPDISAPGCQSNDDFGVTSTVPGNGYDSYCGTSMASPTVCGLSALILQDFKALYPGDPLPRNSTLKILLAHNAADRGNVGPDYKFGYGSVRIKDTIDFLRGGSFLEDSVGHGEDKIFVVDVLPGAASLKATVAWDDPPGAVNTIPELVNDLDIVAISPGGATTHYPWTLDPSNGAVPAVQTQPDHANNIEQVVVDSPSAGTWTIRVSGYSVPSGPQVFSLTTTPDMQLCSSAGVLALSAGMYNCTSTAGVTVIDCDLNADPGAVETVTVNVQSTTEPVGEDVLLTETTPNSAKFVGTLPLSDTDSPGVLQVGDGDTVTAVYNDADDGSGSPAVVQATARVDCVAPMISNVIASVTTPFTAVVTFDTDEPAWGRVTYGLSCGALTEGVSGISGQTSHTLNLMGLNAGTTYFLAVEATDGTGNTATDDNGGSCYTFTTPPAPDDYFTEQFTASDNDLDNLSMTLVPNGTPNYYAACVDPIVVLPTDPSGGTSLPLSDDDYEQVILSGGTVSLHGQSFGEFYVGSNGYITFTSGDRDLSESLSDHFAMLRISGLFDDLNPSAGGTVSWKELGDRVAITWENVPEFGSSNSNTFQIEMFFDGRIAISWLGLDATDGLAGLSPGFGSPPGFTESDLSGYGSCGPRAPIAMDVSASTGVDTAVDITLVASDDGTPGPLSYIITSLPSNGSLSDPGAGPIGGVPYTLVGGGDIVTYTPVSGYIGPDSFTYKANDGGTPPDGGDSNEATVSIRVADCSLFFDDFATTTLDPGNWINTSGGPTVDDVGINEPSEPYSLRLNGTPSGGDGVESRVIDLSGEGGVELNYWYEQAGGGESPDPGEDLVVEFLNGAGAWVELDRRLGSGPDMTSYEERVITLPAGAYHAGFQFRFSSTGSTCACDDWFVDDVCLGHGPPQPPVALNGRVTTCLDAPADVTLVATDDGRPDPPGALSRIIISLPSNGSLSDPGAGPIGSVPYTLAGNGNQVVYTPGGGYVGSDSFEFKANDGGTPPEGGDSNAATISITVADGAPPSAPTNPDPADGAIDMPLDADLSWDPSSGACAPSLYAAATDDGALSFGTVHRASGAFSAIGSTGETVSSMAYDRNTNTVYAVDTSFSPSLHRVDPLTGGLVSIAPISGTLGDLPPLGLAFDPNTNTLYGTTAMTLKTYLYSIDTSTGVATQIGSPALGSLVTGLAFDPGSNSLYGVSNRIVGNSDLVRIDTASGAHTTIGSLGGGISQIDGLAFCGDDGLLYAINSDTEELISIDPATGLATVIGSTGTTWSETHGLTCGSSGMTYDVYFGTEDPPTNLVCGETGQPTCDPGSLDPGTTYYWQVVAGNCCSSATGPVWSFTTEGCNPPDAPSDPAPADGATDVPVDTDLAWNGEGGGVPPGGYGNRGSGVGNWSGEENVRVIPIQVDRAAQQARLEALDIRLEDGGLLTVADRAVEASNPGGATVAFTATIVFDNMPGDVYDTTIGYTLSVGEPIGTDFDQGNAFIPTATGTLTDVWLAVGLAVGPNELDVWLMDDAGGQPGAVIHTMHFSGQMGAFGNLNPPLHWTGVGPTIFTGTQYWLIASTTGPDEWAAWNLNSIGDVGPHASRVDMGPWAAFNDTRAAFRIGIGEVGNCPTTYDVYFGTDNPPTTLICNDTAELTCDPGTLDPGVMYYWQVVANNAGGSTPSPVWSFATQGCSPPAAPSNPDPADGAVDVPLEADLSWGVGGGTGVVINEIDMGDPDWIELFNAGGSPVEMTTWQLIASRDNGSDVTVFTLPTFTLGPGAYVVLHETAGTNTPTDLYFDQNVWWVNGSPGSCALIDAAGVGVDFVRWANSTGTVPSTDVPPAGTNWTGNDPNAMVSYTHSLGRDGVSMDTDDGTDWENTSGADADGKTPGSANVGGATTAGPGGEADPDELIVQSFTGPGQGGGGGALGAPQAPTTSESALSGEAGTPQPRRTALLAVVGSLIFDGGAPDLVNGNEMTRWAQADDFALTADTTLQSVRFWTLEDPGAWDGTCTYSIYTDASGLPGALVDSGAVSLARSSTGRSAFGDDEWENEFDLPAALPLTAGTYWLVLHMSSDCVTRDEVYWETGSPGFGSTGVEDYNCGSGWNGNGRNHAFQLFGGTGAGCSTTYDVYLDTSDPPTTLVCDDTTDLTCDPGVLDPGVTYYWQVVANNSGGSVPGPVWSFTTEVPNDFNYQVVVLDVPSAADTGPLPTSVGGIQSGQTFIVELWATDEGAVNTGLSCVFADLIYDPAEVTVNTIDHCAAFTDFGPSGTDDGAGTIDELGGCSFAAGLGVEPGWACVARVEMVASAFACDPTCGQYLVTFSFQSASGESSAYGRGAVATADIVYGTTDVTVNQSCVYDVDGDCFVNAVDIGLIAPSWLTCAGDPDFDPRADFDCSGCFAGGDIGFFATGWMKNCDDPTVIFPPCRACPGGGALAGGEVTGPIQFGLRLVAALDGVEIIAGDLPAGIASAGAGQTVFAEFWVRDVNVGNPGVVAAYADLAFDVNQFRAVGTHAGTTYGLLASATVGNDQVSQFGGATLLDGVALGQWVRVGAVELLALVDVGEPTLSLAPASIDPAARYGIGAVAAAGIEVINPFGSSVSSDLDGDGDVDVTDFLTFVSCFNGTGKPPAAGCLTPAADLDGDGDVDVTDFLTFASCFNGSANPPACE